MYSTLPPVRRAVPLARGSVSARSQMEQFFGGRPTSLYASGTAALARAMMECAAGSAARVPHVVLPAYGCPDLVAACIHASVQPRLVDLAPSGWGYDPGALRYSLTQDTVAVVAVNLLGIGDDAPGISRLCREKRIPLIQDSAQFLPRAIREWQGDYVVLSFGRGKPLNLLHGGALVRPLHSEQVESTTPALYPWRARLLASRPAAVAFNTLTRPHAYRVLSALPGTNFGRVAYKPLGDAAPLPQRAWKQVGRAFELYRQQPSYSRQMWELALQEWPGLGIESLLCPPSLPDPEPLRLPLLAPDRASRDTLVANLNRYGLGASAFYRSTLPHITDVPDVVREQGPFPNADALADRVFTLPTHQLVTRDKVALARSVVSGYLASIRQSNRRNAISMLS
jgi:DegT/DnrJ/EryC1/StrS aminotransferase family